MKRLFTGMYLAIFGLMGLSLPVPTTAAPIMVKLAHPNVPQHPMGQAFITFKQLIEQRSNGKFRVDVLDSSKFGNASSVIQGLQMGMLQMGSESTSNLSIANDKLLLFDMPFLFSDYASTDIITDGPIGQELAKSLERTGIIGLGYIDIGFRNLYNGKKAITVLNDAKGMKIRATNSKAHLSILKLLGMNPTPMGWSEVYTALQQGTVDGVDIDLNLAWYNNFHEVNKNVTIINSFYSPHMVMMSKKFMNTLSPTDKKMFLDTFHEVQLLERNMIRENEKMIVEKMQQMGIKVVVISPEERAQWQQATQGIYTQFAKQVPPALVQQVREAIKK
ncbi:MAG: TRAP transporter substrate-binding protein [Desulfovibrionaceae bacterium]